MEKQEPATLRPVDRPLSLVPVGLKEAALDSPTFRATAVYFAEQVDQVEKWLDGYLRAGNRLTNDILQLESSINSWLQQAVPPPQVTEAVLDHDYALLAAKSYAEGAREFWQASFRGIKRSEKNVIDPIRSFLQNDVRHFRDARRTLDACQRNFDTILARYAGQPKTKESSSLREDAFQLHEARKSYLKASMDICMQAPSITASLDRLVVRIFSEQWKEAKSAQESQTATSARRKSDMDRIKGWSREMENSEQAFKRELQMARKQIEETVEQAVRPARELDEYTEKPAPFLGSNANAKQRPEKQGWLFLKQVTGKPARTVWSRRWFFVKSGIFGWLVQGSRSAGVEESEKTGILLCSIRPALQEERRFCFEVKTKDTSVVLQAESHHELSVWIDAFELAKRKALEDPGSTDSPIASNTQDAAFAINPPVAPEFAAKLDIQIAHSYDEASNSLGISDGNSSQIPARSSFDVAASRRVTGSERDSSDSTPRIIQKLDISRKATPSPAINPGGGIASLISSSHNILPVGPHTPTPVATTEPKPPPKVKSPLMGTHAVTSLAPSTLANPPAPTNLSKTAVAVSGERGINIGQIDGTGMPGGIMANLWGSEKWGAVNRLERDGLPTPKRNRSMANSPDLTQTNIQVADDVSVMDGQQGTRKESSQNQLPSQSPAPAQRVARKPTGAVPVASQESATPWDDGYPKDYPLALRAQDAQFKVLFPDVHRTEKVVLVFRATWNPNESQEFPGRVFITTREIYFYSNHLGFVLISGVSMETITEVTAAPGRDCDFLFIHIKDGNRPEDLRRVTIRTFLEPLRMLQKRINFLVQNANAEEPADLETVIKTLLRLENPEEGGAGDNEGWEELGLSPDEADQPRLPRRREFDVKPSLRIDGNVYGDPIAKTGRDVTRFKLPAQAIIYVPPNAGHNMITKDCSGSAKALFHIIFGDKSIVFQQIFRERGAAEITQSAWNHAGESHSKRTIAGKFDFGTLVEVQTIDVQNDHLCYVVTSTRVPVQLPLSDKVLVMVKYVITHSAKSHSRLAIFGKVVWVAGTPLSRAHKLVEGRLKRYMDREASEIVELAMSQITKIGTHNITNKAVNIFGHVGQATQPIHLVGSSLPPFSRSTKQWTFKRYTLLNLYWQEIVRQALKYVSLIFDFIDATAKSIMSLVTGHSLLVLFLLLSVSYNSWYSYRDGTVWWQERSAARYMARLGVRSDHSVSRALYQADLHALALREPTNATYSKVTSPSECQTQFVQILATDPELYDSSMSLVAGVATTRLQSKRRRLAGFRHDLIVALKVVNKVEEEAIDSAWRQWLGEELRRCSQASRLLRQGGAGPDDGRPGLETYCAGCRTELDALKK